MWPLLVMCNVEQKLSLVSTLFHLPLGASSIDFLTNKTELNITMFYTTNGRRQNVTKSSLLEISEFGVRTLKKMDANAQLRENWMLDWGSHGLI